MLKSLVVWGQRLFGCNSSDTGTVLNFNGSTEWALDVAKDDALWLAREDQLRAFLGGTFQRLEHEDGGYVVTTVAPDGEQQQFRAAEPADAYAMALLVLVRSAVEV